MAGCAWYQAHPAVDLTAIWMRQRNIIKLHVPVFLRMNTWMFETCRRHCNWINTLKKCSCCWFLLRRYIAMRGSKNLVRLFAVHKPSIFTWLCIVRPKNSSTCSTLSKRTKCHFWVYASFYVHGSVHRESNLITVQQDATYSVYYISVSSCTCFGYWHPSSAAGTAVITATGID